MKEKIIEALPVIRSGAVNALAFISLVVDSMKDLRTYKPEQDKDREYRIDEIAPEIRPLLEKARQRRGQIFITQKGIDLILQYQKKDLDLCKRYIHWKYLGDMTYSEAFGGKEEQKNDDLRLEVSQLRVEVAALTEAIKELRSAILIEDFKKKSLTCLEPLVIW